MIQLTEFKSYLVEQGKSDHTISAYLHDLTRYAHWYSLANDMDLTMATLTAVDVRQYKVYLSGQLSSPATINRRLAALKSFIAWGISSHQIEYNPLAGTKAVRQAPRAPKWLSKQEQLAVLRELERARLAARSYTDISMTLRNQVMVTILLNTGLRISEICDLIWEDVQLGERRGRVTVRNGKGAKRREVPLNLAARQAFKTWGHPDGAKIFPISPRAVQEALAEIGRRAKVDLTPHKLRHTFAKSLVDLGVNLERVAAILGHDRLETTTIYTTPSQYDLEQAVELLE